MQHCDESESAMLKYRVLAAMQPNLPQVWVNVGQIFCKRQVRGICASPNE